MPDPLPVETDRVMVASAGVLSAPDPEVNAELATEGTVPLKKKRKKLGFGFWFSVIWIFLVVFGAAFAPWLPIDNPNVADPCAGVASTMVNTGATPDQAKLIFVGQATSAQQAQSLIDQGIDRAPPTSTGCKNPTLDSRVNAYPSATHILGTDTSGRDTFSRRHLGRPGGHHGRHRRHRRGHAARRHHGPAGRLLPRQARDAAR